ncbi:hypothetical protein Ancab_037434 [Ancistrocladus abbreviatus]
MDGNAKIDGIGEAALIDASLQDIVLNGGSGDGVQTLHPRNAWVCCDACDKWLCIPAALADIIEETNCRWTCKDNQDKAFADCSIPQEKSNEEINAELEISDEEDAHGASGLKTYARRNSSGWPYGLEGSSQIDDDVRSKERTSLSFDTHAWWVGVVGMHLSAMQIMVCHCKPARDGRLGCGDECLNWMLNIECVRGTCPHGELGSDQQKAPHKVLLQFQTRNYAKLKWFQGGKKGYGLQVLEDISHGRFLIEYVGEVVDLQTYEARQRQCGSNGHKHFYFMTLNGNEGEELTFDYNYVHVFGAAAKKCYCSATQCRGYIDGDPLNAEVLVQCDSDDEHPEPVMLNVNGEIDSRLESAISISSSMGGEKVGAADSLPDKAMGNLSEDKDVTREEKSITDGSGQLVIAAEKDSLNESVIDLLMVNDSSQTFETLRTEDALDKPPLPGQQEIPIEREATYTSSLSTQKSDSSSLDRIPSKIFSESVDASRRRSEFEMAEGKRFHSKSHLLMKISHSSKPIEIHKSNCSLVNAEKASMTVNINKPFVLSHKPKKLSEGSANGHLEAVEEKLNDLLDANGGICKRKARQFDASRGYLKLLLPTAASGDNSHGGTIQSNRDLSMILDAILKTKSRGVLVDIINKNEFLAEKEMLTGERINADPPCPGVERLGWGARPSEAIDLIKLSLPSNNSLDTRMVEGSSQAHKEQNSLPKLLESFDSSPHCGIGEARVTQINGARQEKSCTDSVPGMSSPSPGFSPPPPGFSCPLDGSQVQCTACSEETHCVLQNKDCQRHPSEVSMGHPQKRYGSGLPVAYGMPFSAIQQFRTQRAAQVDGWIVAPGIPLHPFPPLPPYPFRLDKRDPQDTWAASNKMIIESSGQVRDYGHYPALCHMDQGMPSASCESLPDAGAVRANYQHIQQWDRDFLTIEEGSFLDSKS